MFGVTNGDDGVNLLDQLLLLVVIKVHVPLGQSRLAGAVLDQNESNLAATRCTQRSFR